MKLTIKTMKGEKFEIQCVETNMVSDVKEIIQQQMGIEKDSQKLISKGKHLSEEKSLQEQGIKDGDHIIVMTLKKKTIKKKAEKKEEDKPNEQPIEQ